jgi:hypothetical protein
MQGPGVQGPRDQGTELEAGEAMIGRQPKCTANKQMVVAGSKA